MEAIATGTIAPHELPPRTKWHHVSVYSLHGAGLLLVITVWVSAGLFGLYILAFYVARCIKAICNNGTTFCQAYTM